MQRKARLLLSDFLNSFGSIINLRYSRTIRIMKCAEKCLLIIEIGFSCALDGNEIRKASTFTTGLVVEISRDFPTPCCLTSSLCRLSSLQMNVHVALICIFLPIVSVFILTCVVGVGWWNGDLLSFDIILLDFEAPRVSYVRLR